MTALHDFIQASASYFGLPVDQLTQGSTLDAAQGDMEVVLRIALKPEDVAGIAARMQRMALERKVDEAQAAEAAKRAAELSLEQWRERYNAMSLAGRSRFGSFGRYYALRGVLPESKAVQAGYLPGGPDNVTPEPVALPTHVWLERGEVTEQQKAMAVGADLQGRYAMDPADLTEQQRAKHLGVTSNADDFGGLPG